VEEIPGIIVLCQAEVMNYSKCGSAKAPAFDVLFFGLWPDLKFE
jgi:hypothetical protein